jgi:oxalate decarboxylase/phosphoglucose isomerase-like protein (cupin superfamily)
MPRRAEHGWKHAFIDLGYRLTNPVLVEEIPAGAGRLIGREIFGERAYIGLTGRGYTEVRTPGEGAPREIRWQAGDAFVVPHGHRVGHANPYGEPARFLSIGVALTNELLRFDVEMAGQRPKTPFLLRLLPYEAEDSVAGDIAPSPGGSPVRAPPAPSPGLEYVVYEVPWGRAVNLRTIQTGPSLQKPREAAGWKSAHIELGGKILNWFAVQDLPAHTREVGHRHGQDAVFLALEGNGRTLFHDQEGEPEPVAIEWGPNDLFCLPVRPDGIFHGHDNPTDRPARLLAVVNRLVDATFLDPSINRSRKNYRAIRDLH